MPSMPTMDPTDRGNKPGDGPLRAGGSADSMQLTSTGDRPDKRSPASQAQVFAEQVCRDCHGGHLRVNNAGLTYLPKAQGESATNYTNRLARSFFHNFFSTAINGMVGLIYRKDPVLEGVGVIEEHWENIDLEGTNGDVWVKSITEDAMVAGHAAILVEFPEMPEGATRADELEVRPYWVAVKKKDILSWRTMNIAGVKTLVQVVIRQRRWVADGRFGEKMAETYLVIERGVLLRREEGSAAGETAVRWQELMINDNGVVDVLRDGLYRNQTEIPLAEVQTSGYRSMFESEPPLVDVAFLNLAHYQMWSDYNTAIHKTNVPVLVLTGVKSRDADGNPVTVTVGPNTVLTLENPQADGKYVSHDGAALGSTKDAMDALKADIGTMSLSMLAPQKRTAETAEAKRLDKSQSDSALSTTARSVQDALETAMGYHMRYLGLEFTGSVSVNRDFEGLLLDAPLMQAYATLYEVGFPPRVILQKLQEGGRIPEDENLDELLAEMEANRMADVEARAEAASAFGGDEE